MIKIFLRILIDYNSLSNFHHTNSQNAETLKKLRCLIWKIETKSMFFRSKKMKTNKTKS